MELALPSIAVSVRPATVADLPFIDSLQKLHADRVGWMPTKTLEGKIGAGHVLVAEEMSDERKAMERKGQEAFNPLRSSLDRSSLLGYCIGTDRYFKRDDVGVIYQMNVQPGRQRGLVGATLLKAMFERSAYGCRLFCCWCAQDIEANKFWEAMGFVPLAYRAGSEKKGRVHIFWQKRIRSGDVTTPYWFPSQTTAGSIREDRLVLPIPPGVHWSAEMPRLLPTEQAPTPALPRSTGGGSEKAKRPKPAPRVLRGLWFLPKPEAVAEQVKKEPKPKREKRKNDPRLVAAARELRDRWLEQVNAGAAALPAARGKYEVSRVIEGTVGITLALPPMAA